MEASALIPLEENPHTLWASLVEAVHADSMLWTRTDALGETSAGGQTALLAGEPTIDELIKNRKSVSHYALEGVFEV